MATLLCSKQPTIEEAHSMCCKRELAVLAVEALEEGHEDHFYRYAEEMSFHCGDSDVTRSLAAAGAGQAYLELAVTFRQAGWLETATRYERTAQRYLNVNSPADTQRLGRLALPPRLTAQLVSVG